MIKLTLDDIRKYNPCVTGYNTLVYALHGKVYNQSKNLYHERTELQYDEEFGLEFIIESNGIKDAIWAMRCLPAYEKTFKHFMIDVVRLQRNKLSESQLQMLDDADLFIDGKKLYNHMYEYMETARNQLTYDEYGINYVIYDIMSSLYNNDFYVWSIISTASHVLSIDADMSSKINELLKEYIKKA